MRKWIIMAMAFAWGSLSFAEEGEVLAKIEAANQGVKTLEGAFSQTRHLAAVNRTVEMKGQLYFSAPDRMAMHYEAPEGDLMVINQSQFYSRSGSQVLHADTSKGHLAAGLTNVLLHCFQGKVQQVASDNDADLSVQETADSYVITLKSRKKVSRGYTRIVLSYRKRDGLLLSMQTDEPAGIRNTYLIRGWTVNQPIDDTKYNIPKK